MSRSNVFVPFLSIRTNKQRGHEEWMAQGEAGKEKEKVRRRDVIEIKLRGVCPSAPSIRLLKCEWKSLLSRGDLK